MKNKENFYICKFIAHRGESFDAPENTLASINLAWKRNAEAVEIDIQLTKDKKIVVIHDYNTKRTGGRNKKVKHQTLDELKELDVGSFKDIKWKGEKIPTLKEVLKTVPANKKIIIEIKCGIEIIPFLKIVISNSGLKPQQIEFISFNLPLISQIKNEFHEHVCLWILNLDYSWINKLLKPSWNRIIHKTIKNNLDGINVWAGNILTKEIVNKIKKENLLFYTWTVNDPAKAKNLIEIGLNAITTDRISWITSKIHTDFKQHEP